MLSSLDGSLPLPGTRVTLAFGNDGTANGTDGCNQFNGAYTQDGSNLTFAQPMASTMMACEDAIMSQATAYMNALAATTDFVGSTSQLVLRGGDEILATFVAESQDLAGTNWQVTGYNNGREAVVGVIDGSEITANFGTDGQLSGEAGCNNYSAGYTVNGDTLTIGEIANTFRFCESPPDVMTQEAEYLIALSTVATFGMEGNLMVLRAANGETAVLLSPRLEVDLPQPEPEPAMPTGRVTAPSGVNIRSGPGTHYPILGFAVFGDEGEIVGRNPAGTWWAVSVPSAPNGIAWVSADFVLASNVADVPVIEPAPPVAVPPIVVTPIATRTPIPAATATPTAQISLWADQTSINQGQCTRLNWDVQNVQAVWVYPRGENYARFPRAGQGSEQVCPTATTTYEMRVLLRDGSTVFREVTVNVVGQAPTATPTNTPQPAPTNTPQPAPTNTPATDLLNGTRWEVVQFNDGNGISTLIADTRITTEFGADGQVTGNGGCNGYFGTYSTSNNEITISSLGATSQLCPEPEGVMEQEAAFLLTLPSATRFLIDGNRLELRNSGDQIVAIMDRAP